jgi:nucleoside-diphosphate-sugar epimerase
MKTVLLTGATGLIGKEATLPLQKLDFEVCTPSHSEMDIFDAESISKYISKVKPNYLLHFAWFTGKNYLIDEVNLKLKSASLDLLKIFQQNGGQRAVFAGTCFETLDPKSLYAQCKDELRGEATKYAKQNGLSFGWGRIFYVLGHGEREPRLLPYIANTVRRGEKATINGGSLVRDYLYSRDIASAFADFLDGAQEGVADICSGEGIRIRDLALLIAGKLGHPDLLEFAQEQPHPHPVIVGRPLFGHRHSLVDALDEIF